MGGLRRCLWFWTAVPVGAAGVLGFLVLGLLGLLPPLVFGLLLLSRPTARSSGFGLVAGAGLPLIYTAYVQRDGPGSTCWRTATASGCDQHLNPLPWLVAGLLLFLAALLASVLTASGAAKRQGGLPVALVTAERTNQVLAVSLPGGQVLRRVHIVDPQSVVAGVNGPAVVVSPTGTVTVLAWRTLHPLAVLRGFRSPQIAAIAPDGNWAYVTDAATGELSVIALQSRRVVDRVFVGTGAHHLAVSPDSGRIWVALGETATTIVVLDSSLAGKPRVIGRIHPPTPAHDLAFAPSGKTLWVGSADSSSVSVLGARSGRLLATIPAGPPPQHVAFLPYDRPAAYVTSGYGSQLEVVDPSTRKVLRRASVPYGSFNIAAAGGIVVTSSLLTGRVTEYNATTLRRWMSVKLAPTTRDVAISVW